MTSSEIDDYNNLLINLNKRNKDILKLNIKSKSNINLDCLFSNLKDNITKYIESKSKQNKNKINEKQLLQCNNLRGDIKVKLVCLNLLKEYN